MTGYHGGKQRIGKKLAEVIYDISTEIEDDEDFNIKGYCEPFCGMLGVYQHIPDLFEDHKLVYKAGDTNKSVIQMWKDSQNGWKPPNKCTEQTYLRLKKAQPSGAKGFIGHQCSFGGIFFGGFIGRYGKSTNITKSSEKVRRIASKLANVKFSYGKYTQYSKLKGYIIYCDPPYSGTQCRYGEQFDTEKFHRWCDKMSEHNIVFVSEYSKPDGDVTEVYKSNARTRKAFGNQTTGSEKMFVYNY